ncbi:MAG: EAL domain-containing protein [Candidatus Contendobacter sp.]|nr:EAL domain-containing protein [Candidatus Contendobacter sp.]
MSTCFRALRTVCAGFAVVLLVIWGVDHGIVQPAFVTLERTQALEDNERARAAIQSELRQLDNVLGYWAAWDDAHAFADSRDPAFIQSNLGDWRSLEKNSSLNLCLILNRDGQALYSGGYDSDLGGTVLPAAFAGESPAIWAALRPMLEQEQARTGLLLTEYGVLLLAVRPILTTPGTGPARGLLILGRFLDKTLLRTLVKQTQVTFDLWPTTDSRLAPAERDYLTTLRANEPGLRAGPAGALLVYALLPDWTGQPTVLLRTSVRRDISTTARRTGQTLVGTLGLTALALLLGGAYLRTRSERIAATEHSGAALSTAALVILIGLTLTYGLFTEWRQRSRYNLARDFQGAAAEQSERIVTAIQHSLEDIDVIRYFLEGAKTVSRRQFHDFTTPVLEQHPLQALEWLPRVPRDQRSAYEAAARQDGLEGFQFTEQDAEGRLVPAADRAEYFPVYYLEPRAGNAVASGFSPGPAHPARGAALTQACDHGQLTATGRYILVQEPASSQRFSVLVFAPVYDGPVTKSAVEEYRARLRGFVLGAIRVGDVVSDALYASEPGQLTFRLLDLTADHEQRWLYDHPSPADFQVATAAVEWHFQRDFDLADRAWRIEVAPSAAFMARHHDLTYRWVPAIGGLLTLLTALYLFALVSQRQRADRLVAARTAELRASEERYRIVALMTGQMIYDYDCPTGRIQWAGAIAALTGQDDETFAAVDIDAWAERIHPEDRPDALDRLRQAMAAGTPYEVEYRFARGDGAYGWIADHGAFLLDERGIAIRMLGAMQDVTERKLVAAELEARAAQLRTLIDVMPDVVCFKDGAGHWLEANAFAVQLFRLEGVAYRGKTNRELAEHNPARCEALQRCEETDEFAWRQGEPSRSDERILQPDGTEHIFDVIKIPRFDDQGRRHNLVVVGRDVTDRHRAETALSASERRFRAMIEHAPDGIALFNETIRYASPAVERLLGYTPEEATALDHNQLTHPEDRPSLLSLLNDLLGQPGHVVSTQYRFRHKDGSWRWLESTISNLLAEPSVGALVINFRDITDRWHAEARQRLAAAVFEAAQEAIFVADAKGRILAVNPAFTTLTGYAETAVQGRSPRLLWAEHQPETYFETLEQIVADEGVWQGEFWAQRQDGERRAMLANLCAVRDATGRTIHHIGVATDITAQKAAEQRIERLAYYDALTELPNRTLLTQRAKLALALAARHHTGLAVLFLDLDRFKEVNDALGHGAGDVLLAQVAARLQGLVRAEDTVCRLGGDEFVLLLSEANQEGALRVADKILAAFRQPFIVADHALNVTASVGVALYPHDGVDFAELLKNADAALYRAKHAGRNTRTFYDRAMNAATLARMVLEAELRQALVAGQLRAYYQPKVRLTDGVLIGAEALVRWQHPERGLIPPGQFVPVAEASDLIVALGDWMLVEVCRQLSTWRRQGKSPLTVAINLAARHFRQPGLADHLHGLLEAYGLPAQALELELTESTLLDASADTVETLRRLERLGMGLALDDFGTGYSNLSYLKHLPLTALKIDQGFVRDLVTDPDDRVIAATIVALGHHLELAVIAEGVETEDQRRILLEQGCDLAQGYLFSQPLPAEAFATDWLAPTHIRPI